MGRAGRELTIMVIGFSWIGAGYRLTAADL